MTNRKQKTFKFKNFRIRIWIRKKDGIFLFKANNLDSGAMSENCVGKIHYAKTEEEAFEKAFKKWKEYRKCFGTYHFQFPFPNVLHDDECDCVACRARVEKGGLDFDPTNDDEEFEEHERQVFRDLKINKEKK